MLMKIIKVFLNGLRCLWYTVTGSISEVTITGLKPDTSYEVRLSAINGKGESESSPSEFLKTEPVRKWHMLHSLQHTSNLLEDFFDPCLHKHITRGPLFSLVCSITNLEKLIKE